MQYLAYKCKAEVVSKFHLFKNSSIMNVPICCSAEDVPLETTQHTLYTQQKYLERATGQAVSHKCSQASTWDDTLKSKAITLLSCHDLEAKPLSDTSEEWQKERESWECAPELCTSAKASSTMNLWRMPQLIFGLPLPLPSQAILRTPQLKAGAPTNGSLHTLALRNLPPPVQGRSRTQSLVGPTPRPPLRGLWKCRGGKGKQLSLRLMAARMHETEEAGHRAVPQQWSSLGAAMAMQSSDSQHCLQGHPVQITNSFRGKRTDGHGENSQGFFLLSSVIIGYLWLSETTCIFSQTSWLPVRTKYVSTVVLAALGLLFITSLTFVCKRLYSAMMPLRSDMVVMTYSGSGNT